MRGTRREFIKRAGGGAVAVSALGTFGPLSAVAAPRSDGDDLRQYAAFASTLGIPLVTADPATWSADLENRLPPSAASRAQTVAADVAANRRALDLQAADVYGGTQRLNAYLRSRPEVQPEMQAALSAVVDPNGFVDTAALARGEFPEDASQSLPRLAPFPLG